MAHVVANHAGRSVLPASVKGSRIPPQCLARAIAPSPARFNRSSAHGLAQHVIPRRNVVARAKIEKINGEQLEVAIATRDTTLIVDFFATWCGPCLLLARELEQVADELKDKVKVVKIDVDENPDLSNMLKIQGLPTIVFIPKADGKPALRTEGLLPAAQIIEIVTQLESGNLQQQQQQPEQEQQQQQ